MNIIFKMLRKRYTEINSVHIKKSIILRDVKVGIRHKREVRDIQDIPMSSYSI